MKTVIEIIEDLKKQVRDSWSGETGEGRAADIEKFINEMLENYHKHLGVEKAEILNAIDGKRKYSAVNYYQSANFPMIEDGVMIFENEEEMMKEFAPENGFRCPACNGVSKNPYNCNSGLKNEGGKICDWKSFGFLGTLGEGLRFTIKDSFLEKPMIDECFMPVALESKNKEVVE